MHTQESLPVAGLLADSPCLAANQHHARHGLAWSRGCSIRTPAAALLTRAAFGVVFGCWLVAPALRVGAATPALTATNAPSDFSLPLDAAFTNALAVVRSQIGLREVPSQVVFTDWRTNLCLLLGFRVDVGAKRFVHLIEVTTLPFDPPAGTNRSKVPRAANLDLTFAKNSLISTSRVHRFTSPRYPVQIRVYDEQGAFLRGSREQVSWSFLTNGLNRGCLAQQDPALAAVSNAPPSQAIERQLLRERAFASSLPALFSLFGDTLSADSLEGVRDQAIAIVRKPNPWKILVNFGLELNLMPRFEDVLLLPPGTPEEIEPRAWLPVSLQQGERLLVSVEFVTGATAGPYFLTGGVRALRAVHPAKADRRLLAQVLAAGEVTRQASPPTTLHR